MLKYRVSVLIEHWHQAAGNETEEDAFRALAEATQKVVLQGTSESMVPWVDSSPS